MPSDKEYKPTDFSDSEPPDKATRKSDDAVRTQSRSRTTSNKKSREDTASSNSPSEKATYKSTTATEFSSLSSSNKKRRVIPAWVSSQPLLRIVNPASNLSESHDIEKDQTPNHHNQTHLNRLLDSSNTNIGESVRSHFQQNAIGVSAGSTRLIDLLDQRSLGATLDHPIVVDTEVQGHNTTGSDPSLSPKPDLNRTLWNTTDFRDYQRQYNCALNRERAEFRKQLEKAETSKKILEAQLIDHKRIGEIAIDQVKEDLQREESLKDQAVFSLSQVTEDWKAEIALKTQAREYSDKLKVTIEELQEELRTTKAQSLDRLNALQIELGRVQDQLTATETQRDSAREQARTIKRKTEAIWKERVSIHGVKSKEVEDLKKQLKDYTEEYIAQDTRIRELENRRCELIEELEDVSDERDQARKEIQAPSWKLVAQLKTAERNYKEKSWELARLEARKGQLEQLTPPFRNLTVQDELISDLTNALILLSKWCTIKEFDNCSLQTQRLKDLLNHPEGFPLVTAFQSISLLVRQISFLQLHLAEGQRVGPGQVQPPLHFDLEAISHLVSQERHLVAERQIDFNCIDPEGFQRISRQAHNHFGPDHRRGLQDYLYSSYCRDFQQASDLSTQSSSTTQTRTRALQDDLFEAAQSLTLSQLPQQENTSEDSSSDTEDN